MLPSSGHQIDTKPEADPPTARGQCSRVKWTRHLSSGFVVGLVAAAVLDLGFGISFSSIARYFLPPVVVLSLVVSVLDYCSDGLKA